MRRKLIPYNPQLKELARKLRNESTFGEVLLWKELSNKKMHGFDFHGQKPLLNYIVDFYCFELCLVIEIDGVYHSDADKSLSDKCRDKALMEYGLTILRFAEQDVRKDMENVLRTIEAHIVSQTEGRNL